MNRKQKMSLSVASIALASLVMTAVTVSSRTVNTPLYTYRIEQASSEMNFLPTEMNNFAYTIEKGFTLEYDSFEEQSDVESSPNICITIPPLCTIDITCSTVCQSTCANTCPSTCTNTCDNPTCGNTCETCGNTCPDTCGNTCPDTCWLSCNGTCITC